MSQYRFFTSIAVLGLSLMLHNLHAGDQWPQWRGPGASGFSDSTGLPAQWDAEKNIVWKIPLPSWASSTPIVWDDRIYIVSPNQPEAPKDTTTDARGNRQAANTPPEGGHKIMLLCYSRADGSPVWQAEAAGGNRMFRKHNASTPSPVTDGKHIWMVTGAGVISAFDMQGDRKWSFDLIEAYGENGARHAYGSSPVVHDGNLYIQMLHGYDNDNASYVMAFNGATGDILWHRERPTDAGKRTENRDAYTTPFIATIGGKPQLVVVGAQFITSHDLANGGELMRLSGLNANEDKWNRLVASSFVHDGKMIVTSRKNAIFAYDIEKLGEDPAVALLWKFTEQPLPDVPSPVSDGRYVYFSTDGGAVSCIDGITGKRVWGPEQSGLGTTSSSMVYADGKVYLSDESGATVVLAAGPEFKVLALNKLDGSYTLASPAISGNRMFIRTAEFLYCIGNQ